MVQVKYTSRYIRKLTFIWLHSHKHVSLGITIRLRKAKQSANKTAREVRAAIRVSNETTAVNWREREASKTSHSL